MSAGPPRVLLAATAFGGLAGLRVLTPPAVLLFAQRKPAAWVVALFASGELLADKLPATPPRVVGPALALRALGGGAWAAVFAKRGGACAASAFALGAAAAVGTSVASFAARVVINARTGAADTAVAVVEDALAIGASVWLVSLNSPA